MKKNSKNSSEIDCEFNWKYPRFIAPAYLDESKYTLIRASRRSGKTFNASIWLLSKLLANPNTMGLWVDTTQSMLKNYADLYFRKLLMPPYASQDYWKRVTHNRQDHQLTFPNGSILHMRSAQRPELMEGLQYDFIILNEAGIILKTNDIWDKSIMPMTKDGQAKLLGCVNPNTYALSSGGIKRMGGIATIPDKAYTQIDLPLYGLNNKIHRADGFFNNGIAKTIKITTQRGYSIEGTFNHKILTYKNDLSHSWERLDQIKIDDYVCISRGANQYSNEPDQVDEQMAYFLGLYIAEGSSESGGRITICCYEDDIGEYLESGQFRGLKFKKRKEGTWAVNSIAFYREMERLGMPLGIKAKYKYIPDFIFSASKNIQIAFIRGMFDGDGHCKKKTGDVGYSSASELLIHQLHLLLLNMGIVATKSKIDIPANKRVKVASVSHVLSMHGYNAYLYKSLIGFSIKRLSWIKNPLKKDKSDIPYVINFLRSKGESIPSKRVNLVRHELEKYDYDELQEIKDLNYFYDKIIKIEYGECETVDFTVPDTQSYWANGFISHNTPKGKNFFWELWERNLGANYHYTCYECPYWDIDQLTEIKKTTPDTVWLQEYMAEFVAGNEGAVIKPQWIQYYDPSELPTANMVIQSWDMTFKKSDDSDYTVGQLWAKCGDSMYLIDQIRDQMGFNETLNAVNHWKTLYPMTDFVLVEEAANGYAIIDMLSKNTDNVIPIKPTESKYARINSVAPYFANGYVYLPKYDRNNPSDEYAWVHGMIEEMLDFPLGANDDCVDACSQALSFLTRFDASDDDSDLFTVV